MALELNNLITLDIRNKLSKNELSTLEESINSALNSKIVEIEKKTSDKFNALVENLTKKFDDQVNKTIVESVRDNVSGAVNNKMYKIIADMVNLLESAGIATTETTKALQKKLSVADGNLETAYKERQEIKKQLTSAEKENFVLSRLKGMKPEVVNAAIEYFADKDILDVQDEIDAFLDGDFGSLLMDNNREEFAGEINLDQVRDALSEMDTDKRIAPSVNSSTPKFENLSKGLRPQRLSGVRRGPNVTTESLAQSVEQSGALMEVEDDTKTALTQINDFNNLGYRLR